MRRLTALTLTATILLATGCYYERIYPDGTTERMSKKEYNQTLKDSQNEFRPKSSGH